MSAGAQNSAEAPALSVVSERGREATMPISNPKGQRLILIDDLQVLILE